MICNNTNNNAEGKTPKSSPPPYWWPNEVPFERLPENLRAAIEGIIQPSYGTMVVAARPGPEQSSGATIVSLLWLEILQQAELGKDLLAAGPEPERLQKHEKAIGRLLRLAGAKTKATELLMRLQSQRQKLMNTPKAAAPVAKPQPADKEPPVEELKPYGEVTMSPLFEELPLQ
jgi:hypothetical protein